MGRYCKYSTLIQLVVIGTVVLGVFAVHAQQLTTTRLDEPISTAAISPDGRYIAFDPGRSAQKSDGSWESTESIQVLDPASSKIVAKINVPSAALLKDAPLASTDGFVSYCDNGKYLVAYDQIASLYVLNASSYRVESRISLGNLRVHDNQGAVLGIMMTCSAGGSLFAVNAYGGRFGWGLVRLFDLTSGGQAGELRQNPSSGTEFSEISLSPNGSKLAILLKDPHWKRIKGPDVEIRETQSLKLLTRLSTGDAPRGMTFAGESEIVTVQEQPSGWSPPKQALRLWEIESGKEERRFSDAHFDVEAPISSSLTGNEILGAVIKYHECRFCNGMEGEVDVQEQRFAVWNRDTGLQTFRSEPFGPIVEPLGALCTLSQDGTAALIYWPDNQITPRIIRIPNGHPR